MPSSLRIILSIIILEAIFVFCHEKVDQVECSIKSEPDIDESLNHLSQDDPVLIDAVRKLLIPPSDPDVPYNFTAKEPYLMGQFNQVRDLLELLGKQKDGFYIEAGAFDGEEFSNSLYFEMKKKWNGILVEPNPDALAELKTKHRKGYIFPRCLSTKTKPEIVQFDAAGLIGGIIHKGREPGGLELDSKVVANLPERLNDKTNRRTIKLQCFPLYSVLMALGNPTIDLFSLDIEGAEIQVLKTVPWDKVNIRVIIIEVNHIGEIFKGSAKELNTFLKKSGFKFHSSLLIDDIYVKRDFKIIDDK